MTRNDLIKKLREIAPSWAWRIECGRSRFDYYGEKYGRSWGFDTDSLLVHFPEPKFRTRCGVDESIADYRLRLAKCNEEERAAREYVLSLPESDVDGGKYFAKVEANDNNRVYHDGR